MMTVEGQSSPYASYERKKREAKARSHTRFSSDMVVMNHAANEKETSSVSGDLSLRELHENLMLRG